MSISAAETAGAPVRVGVSEKPFPLVAGLLSGSTFGIVVVSLILNRFHISFIV
jgi:hypothetical protein